MNPKALVPLVIWFSTLVGFLIMFIFVGGGLATLKPSFEVRSLPLMLLGFVPLAIAVAARFLLFPKVKSFESFFPVFLVALAVCEGIGIAAMFAFPNELTTEKAFVILGAFFGIALLCPLRMSQLSEH